MRGSAVFVAIALAACTTGPDNVTYPETRRGDVVEELHGVRIADPFRWLEDLDSEETRAWVREQNALTFSYLRGIPQREPLRRRLEKLWNYERFGAPTRRGSRQFWFKNDGLQNHAVLYWREGDGPEHVLLDPNTMSEDGSTSVAGVSFSDDGRWCAYATSRGGSDWNEWHVREVATGKDTDDHLQWVKFSGVSWLPDGSGFLYSRFPAPRPGDEREQANYDHKLYLHRLGAPQSADQLVYERPDQREWGFDGEVSEDGAYIVIRAWVGTDTRTRIFYRALDGGEIRPLVTSFDGAYEFVGNDGPVFYLRTDAEAPRGRLIAVDTRAPEREHWRELIPQGRDVLTSVRMVAHRFVALFMRDAHSRAVVYRRDGTEEAEVPLPGLGTIGQITGRREHPDLYFTFTSFTEASSVWRYDLGLQQRSLHVRPRIAFSPEDYESSQVWYRSKDGTRIPMFIVHKRGIAKGDVHPVYLYGYGGFNISLTPSFSPSVLVWMEMGGVFAQPSLRGGGEYGEAWHKAGMLDKKQNVFDDFVAAAEYLIDAGWTKPERLAIGGGSNGGLLVGACMNQRPDLFGACLPAVGVMDMLRFHKFTIGWAWVSDYGSPDDPAQFRDLLAYSPLHNLKAGESYPATLITTADHDDRVVPAHSFKYAAALQAAQAGAAPCLIRIDTKAGHGAGIPTSKLIDEAADKWAFLARRFELDAPR